MPFKNSSIHLHHDRLFLIIEEFFLVLVHIIITFLNIGFVHNESFFIAKIGKFRCTNSHTYSQLSN